MTENQWPEDPTYTVPPATAGSTRERSATMFPGATAPQATDPYSQSGGTSGTSRKDAVKDEAGEVARTAKDSAQNVVERAKTEAANVASEVKASTMDLLAQARTDLTHQAGAQQQKVADGAGAGTGRHPARTRTARTARQGRRRKWWPQNEQIRGPGVGGDGRSANGTARG